MRTYRIMEPDPYFRENQVHEHDQNGKYKSCRYQMGRLLRHARPVTWCLISLIGVFVFGSMAWAQDLGLLKAGVVRITTEIGQIGTGVIVRVESKVNPTVVYIVTAAHIVAGGHNIKVEFFRNPNVKEPNVQVKGEVLPGAEQNDYLRGLALVAVRERGKIPCDVVALPFRSTEDFIIDGKEVLAIGHSREKERWIRKHGRFRKVENWIPSRFVVLEKEGQIFFEPGLASSFSGSPLLAYNKIVGVVISNRDGLGIGVSAHRVLTYMEHVFTEEAKAVSLSPSQPPTYVKKGKDEAPMLWIPPGKFLMGGLDGKGDWDEQPPHWVSLSGFFLDVYEVTNQQFQKFVQASGYQTTAEKKGSATGLNHRGELHRIPGASWLHPEGEESVFSSGREKHPVIAVTWEDARSYCQGVGKRLPTEAEWEYAARAGTATKNWWGDEVPRPCDPLGNLADKSALQQLKWSWASHKYDDGFIRTAPVGSFLPNPWGLHDMDGNVLEWVNDWYRDTYYNESPEKDPQGPGPIKNGGKVLRGGSWRSNPIYVYSANREPRSPLSHREYFGFRCALSASPF